MTEGRTPALATRGLRKAHGKRVALDGLDLSVPSGVVYGFRGPNGAGMVVGAWLIGSLVVAALFTERAEIGG